MERFPPTANPRIYTLSAMIVGYLLIDNFTANEQNSIGNWFVTIGQILENNCAFQQLMEERINGNTININSKQFKCGGSPFMHNKPLIEDNDDIFNNDFRFNEELDEIKRAIKLIQEQLEKLCVDK